MNARTVFQGFALLLIAATGCSGPGNSNANSPGTTDSAKYGKQVEKVTLQIDGFMKSESGAT